mgnify:CR=1 FL=1
MNTRIPPIRISAAAWKALKKQASKEGRSASALLRFIISEYLRAHGVQVSPNLEPPQ